MTALKTKAKTKTKTKTKTRSTAKTQATSASVATFLERVPDPARRQDCFTVLRLMQQVTRAEPPMWGKGLVGFGRYHYVYASGHEGDCFLAGFAPRKQDLTLYITSGVDYHRPLLGKLGKHKTGKACLYIKRLEDVDLDVLKQLITESVKRVKEMYS
jgi:hypothetical protein